MSSHRAARVAQSLREVVSVLLQRQIKDPRVSMVTVTDVQMSPDLRNARIYYTCPGEQGERDRAAEGLKRAAGFMRAQVTRELNLRYAPDLRFEYDHSIEAVDHVNRLLREVVPPEES